MIYKNFIKPLGDKLLAFIVLIIFFPVMLLIALWLFFANRGKVFFVQERPGYKGEKFFLLKFRTMTDRRNSAGELLPDNERLFFPGRLLRKTSLDELPQLINVLKGDMSFVGPRPLLTQYMSVYTSDESRRHSVKPGITGWAQVSGRNAISWKEKFRKDIFYVDHLSFMLDLKILLLTVIKVLRWDDVNTRSGETMQPYTGKENE